MEESMKAMLVLCSMMLASTASATTLSYWSGSYSPFEIDCDKAGIYFDIVDFVADSSFFLEKGVFWLPSFPMEYQFQVWGDDESGAPDSLLATAVATSSGGTEIIFNVQVGQHFWLSVDRVEEGQFWLMKANGTNSYYWDDNGTLNPVGGGQGFCINAIGHYTTLALEPETWASIKSLW
jgi:hypothetical protein